MITVTYLKRYEQYLVEQKKMFDNITLAISFVRLLQHDKDVVGKAVLK